MNIVVLPVFYFPLNPCYQLYFDAPPCQSSTNKGINLVSKNRSTAFWNYVLSLKYDKDHINVPRDYVIMDIKRFDIYFF